MWWLRAGALAQTVWVQILALPLTSCVTLSKWLSLPEAWLPHGRNGHNTTAHRAGSLEAESREHTELG